MCRMMFMAPPFDHRMVEDLLTYLECQQGGDGNGVALLKPEGVQICKGTRVRCSQLADRIMDEGVPFIFHTRKASIGPVCDTLCQPFLVGRTVVAHNGHWHSWKDYIPALMASGSLRELPLTMSDSKLGALGAHIWGPGFLSNVPRDGVWIYAKTRPNVQVLAVVNSGSLCVDDAGVVASEFPKEWKPKVYKVEKESILELFPNRKLIQGSTKEITPGQTQVVYRAQGRRYDSGIH